MNRILRRVLLGLPVAASVAPAQVIFRNRRLDDAVNRLARIDERLQEHGERLARLEERTHAGKP